MQYTQEEALERISEFVSDNTRDIRQKNRQRRNQVVDLYGIPFYAVGDAGTPAKIYISVSLDEIYYLRFQFKLIIRPFVSTVSGGGTKGAVVTVNSRSLTVTENNNVHTVTPNPHDHTTEPHSHEVASGISMTHTESDNFTILVRQAGASEYVDVTPYLMAQHDSWIDGEGIFPSAKLGETYDLLEAADDMVHEGNEQLKDLLLARGFKEIDIISDAPFAVELHLYLKYEHCNR